MKNNKILNNPNELKNYILNLKDAYIIKIKCIGCTESKYIKYENPIIKGNILIIGNYKYPFDLIESISIRTNNEYIKEEYSYKISSNYLKMLLENNVQQELKKYGLI